MRSLPTTLVYLLFFLLPLAYWPTLIEAASLPRYFLISLLGAGSLLLWSISNSYQKFSFPPASWLILLLFSWAVFSLAWTPDPGNTLVRLSQWFAILLIMFLAMQFALSERKLSHLFIALLAGAAIAAVIGLGQYFGFNPLHLRLNPQHIASTFINRNHAANYFDFIPMLSLVGILTFRNRIQSWFAAGTLGLVIAYLWISKSRGSMLALFASLMFLALILWRIPEIRSLVAAGIRDRKKQLLLALSIPVLVWITPASDLAYTQNFKPLFNEADQSSKIRLALYINSIPAILDHPTKGLGYGGTRVGFLPYSSEYLPIVSRSEEVPVTELHNDFLQYFVELGVPGGVLLIGIVILVLFSGWQGLKSRQDKEQRLILLGCLLAIVASITHALVDFPLWLPASATMFWALIGIILILSQNNRVRTRVKLSDRYRALFLVIAIFGVLSTYLLYKPYFISNHDLYKSAYNLQRGNCIAARDAAEHGMQVFPPDFLLRRIYTEIYTACSFSPGQKMAAMNRILEIDPTILRARLTRAILLNEAGRIDHSVPELVTLATLLPHRPIAFAALGDAARQQNNLKIAEFYYRAALRHSPQYTYAINQLRTITQN